jgi:tripeptidyl-peptidase-1
VLSVGATQGLELDYQRERACQSDTHGSITSGGGFSNAYPRPAYQGKAVAGYLALYNTEAPFVVPTMSPTAAVANDELVIRSHHFNASGRGYPDVAAAGRNFWVRTGGTSVLVAGTSAATPVVAGMVSLVNARRLAAGYPTLGFVNPALYAAGAAAAGIFHDVVDGKNNCVQATTTSPAICCQEGYYGTPGWDPVTGAYTLELLRSRSSHSFCSCVGQQALARSISASLRTTSWV